MKNKKTHDVTDSVQTTNQRETTASKHHSSANHAKDGCAVSGTSPTHSKRGHLIPCYVPTRTDIAWARNMTSSLNEGGILAYPATRLIYRVSHARKQLTLQNKEQLVLDFESSIVHLQTICVFDAIGYKVDPDLRVPSATTRMRELSRVAKGREREKKARNSLASMKPVGGVQ